MRVRAALKAGDLKVYGTDWCGWTNKQRAYLEGKGIVYTFVNCEQQQCPEFVKSFPTLVRDGQVLTGYKEL